MPICRSAFINILSKYLSYLQRDNCANYFKFHLTRNILILNNSHLLNVLFNFKNRKRYDIFNTRIIRNVTGEILYQRNDEHTRRYPDECIVAGFLQNLFQIWPPGLYWTRGIRVPELLAVNFPWNTWNLRTSIRWFHPCQRSVSLESCRLHVVVVIPANDIIAIVKFIFYAQIDTKTVTIFYFKIF